MSHEDDITMLCLVCLANATTTFSSNGTSFYDYNGTMAGNSSGDTSIANCSASSPHFQKPIEQALIYISYITIFVLSLIGNTSVCYVVYGNAGMRNAVNFFIVNLSVGDILLTIFCIPFSFVSTLLLQRWPFGSALCRIVNYSQAVSVFVTAYTLIVISIERFVTIMWPFRPKTTTSAAKKAILVVWIFSAVTALPIAILSRLNQPQEWYEKCGYYICEEEWTNQTMRIAYSQTLMVLQYGIPVGVLIFTYVNIFIMVWCRKPIMNEMRPGQDARAARSKKKKHVEVMYELMWLIFMQKDAGVSIVPSSATTQAQSGRCYACNEPLPLSTGTTPSASTNFPGYIPSTAIPTQAHARRSSDRFIKPVPPASVTNATLGQFAQPIVPFQSSVTSHLNLHQTLPPSSSDQQSSPEHSQS